MADTDTHICTHIINVQLLFIIIILYFIIKRIYICVVISYQTRFFSLFSYIYLNIFIYSHIRQAIDVVNFIIS